MLCHVDDFLYAGESDFLICIMKSFIQTFKVGKHCRKSFRYIGLHLGQSEQEISVDQTSYIKSIGPIDISKERSKEKSSEVTDVERTVLRSVIGQLNWAASQTRPDISFDTCMISTNVNRCTVADLLLANKIVKRLKSSQMSTMFSNLGDPASLRVVVLC